MTSTAAAQSRAREARRQEKETHTHEHVTAEVSESWGGKRRGGQTGRSGGDIQGTSERNRLGCTKLLCSKWLLIRRQRPKDLMTSE